MLTSLTVDHEEEGPGFVILMHVLPPRHRQSKILNLGGSFNIIILLLNFIFSLFVKMGEVYIKNLKYFILNGHKLFLSQILYYK